MAISRPTWKDFHELNPFGDDARNRNLVGRKVSDQTRLEMAEGRRQRYVNSRYGVNEPRNLSYKDFAAYKTWTSNFLR